MQSSLANASFVSKFEPIWEDLAGVTLACIMLRICQVELQLEAAGAKQKSRNSFYRQLLDMQFFEKSLRVLYQDMFEVVLLL